MLRFGETTALDNGDRPNLDRIANIGELFRACVTDVAMPGVPAWLRMGSFKLLYDLIAAAYHFPNHLPLWVEMEGIASFACSDQGKLAVTFYSDTWMVADFGVTPSEAVLFLSRSIAELTASISRTGLDVAECLKKFSPMLDPMAVSQTGP